MRNLIRHLVPLVVLLATAGSAFAQGMPTEQPGIISIFIEEIKVGRDDAHAANESGWPAAFAKANSPFYYLALASMTGTGEVWYVQPFESYAKQAESMKLIESDPAMSAELSRLWAADGQYLNASRVVNAMARPDLSYGAFPDLERARFWDITTFKVRPGHDLEFEAAAKTYAAAAERLAPNISYRTYEVTAGMPGGTYLVLSSVNAYGEFDQMMAADMAVWEGLTERERAVFQQFGAEGMIGSITNRFRLDPRMSYVAPATRAADPEFWNPSR